jgi:hypothetical protein
LRAESKERLLSAVADGIESTEAEGRTVKLSTGVTDFAVPQANND